MTDPADEFAAGLEAAETQQQPTQPAASPAPETNLSRALLEQLRAKGLSGAPDDWTDDTLVDNLVTLQSRADKAAEYEAKIAEYESRAAQQAIQQVQQAKPEVAAPAEEEFAFPYKPVRVDPAFKSLVKVDPASGMFVPTNNASVAHIQAAEEMNRRRAYEAQVVQDLLDDPERFGEVLTKKQLAALETKFAAQFEEFKTQFAPVQQQVAASENERKVQAFCEQHRDTLFTETGMTPIGELVNELMIEDGLAPDVALKQAMKAAARFGATPVAPAPETPAKPASLSKVQQKPARFVDTLSQQSRLPAESNHFNGSAKKRPTMAEVIRDTFGEN